MSVLRTRAIQLMGAALLMALGGLDALAAETPPQAGALCGPPAAVFMTLFTCPVVAHARLFGAAGTQRVLPRASGSITAEAIRQVVATASGQSARNFEVSRGIFFVSNGPHPQAQQTEAGNGYAIVISQVAPAAQINLCAIAGGKMAGPLARVALKENEVLLARMWLDGAAYIMAICATINIDDQQAHAMRPELEEAQLTFGKSLAKISLKNPVGMKMTPLPPGGEDCLRADVSPGGLTPGSSPDSSRH